MNGTVEGITTLMNSCARLGAERPGQRSSRLLSTVLMPSMITTSVAGTAESTMIQMRAASLMPTHSSRSGISTIRGIV